MNLVEAIQSGYDVTVKQAAMQLNYTELHVRSLLREKKIKAIKIHNQWWIERASLDEFTPSSNRRGNPKALREAQAKVEELETELSKAHSQLVNARRRHEGRKQEIAARDRKIEELNAEIKDLHDELNAVSAKTAKK